MNNKNNENNENNENNCEAIRCRCRVKGKILKSYCYKNFVKSVLLMKALNCNSLLKYFSLFTAGEFD